MKLSRCPICHSDLHLDALFEDDAGRELLSLLSNLSHGCGRHLVAYVGLFRPEKSNLSNSRALKLAREVTELYTPSKTLAHALSETVEKIRAKRLQGDRKPLTSHGYLNSVYQTSREQFSPTHSTQKNVNQSLSDSDATEQYLSDMHRRGVDVSTLLNGRGAEWLQKQNRR